MAVSLPPSFHPVCNKNIRIPRAAVISIAAEDQLFTVGAKHGECIKTVVMADLFEPASIAIDRI